MLFSTYLRTCVGEREGERESAGDTGQRPDPQELGERGDGVRPGMPDEDWQPALPPGVLLETYSSGPAGGGVTGLKAFSFPEFTH